MKRLLFILTSCFLLLSCDMWNVDIVAYLEYYTNTAGIELIDYGGNYPEDSSGVVNIPSGAPRTITFTLRNPQSYNLNVSLADWVDGNAPSISGDYTIEQSPNDKSKITLTFEEGSLLSWDKSGGKNLSATVKIQDQESLRDFDDYVYTLVVNSPPIAPSNVSLVKHEDVSNNWFFAFDAGNTLERQGLHGDIVSVTINNRRYDLTTSDGNLNVDDGLSIENPDATNILESAEGLAFIHNEGNSVYLSTEVPTDSSPTYTVFFTDDRGLNSNAITVSSAGKIREHYYVDENGSDETGTGSANNPLRTVEAALDEVVRVNNQSSVFTIHIKGNVSGGASDSESSTVIESDSTLNIRLQGWGDGAQAGTITADANKRVLYVGGAGANVTLGENLTLTRGEAEDGGGVYVASGKLTVDGATISGNTATVDGGGVNLGSGTLIISGHTEISNNEAVESGGGVFIATGTVIMNDSSSIGNNNAKHGAGIYMGSDLGDISFTMSDSSSISNNTATLTGGGVFMHNWEQNIAFSMRDSSSISGNSASDSGGGVHMHQGGEGSTTFTMTGGSIGSEDFPNTARFGGGLFVNGSEALLTMSSGTISYNEASENGAGVYLLEGSSFNFTSGTIQNNIATASGGGVFVDGNGTRFQMDGGTIQNNAANAENFGGGGVFLNNNAHFTLNNGTITGNNALFFGGGVHVWGSTFTMSGGSIGSVASPNTANSGGGVYITNVGSVFTMSGGDITGNTGGGNGAGVSLINGSIFNLIDGRIRSNIATASGGGIYATLSGTKFIMSGGDISSNMANAINYGGGGVYASSAVALTLNGGEIYSNRAVNNGGGIFIQTGSSLTMSGGTINNNISGLNGGGVYVVGDDSTFTMNNASSRIEENSATSGGGVYLHTGVFNLSAGTITANKRSSVGASGGGGVYIDHNNALAHTLNLSGNPFVTGNGVTGNSEAVDNVNFANDASLSPVKINVSLTGGSIGLSPLNRIGDEIVVQGGVTDSNSRLFTSDIDGVNFYKDGNDLKVSPPIDKIYIGNTATGNGDGLEFGNRMAVTNQDQFENAISKLANGSGTMWVVTTLQVSESGTWQADAGKSIILKRYDAHAGDSSNTGALIQLSGASLSLENITIDGQGNVNGLGGSVEANDALIKVTSGASLTLNNGVVLQNNKSTYTGVDSGGNSYRGGAININGGTVTLPENTTAQIKSNQANHGSAIYVTSGTLTMHGGMIGGDNSTDKNIAIYNGAVYVINEAEFTMTGGDVKNNEATTLTGGGVYVYVTGTFTMSGTAKITKNSVLGSAEGKGGGVSLRGNFIMNGGEISGNYSTRYGGAVNILGGGHFTMNDGLINANTSEGNVGGVYVDEGTFTMSGGSITNNMTKDTNGGGVYVETNGTLELSGSPVITNNGAKGSINASTGIWSTGADGALSNVYLSAGKTITLLDSLNTSLPDSSIGISLSDATVGRILVTNANSNDTDKFTFDTDSGKIIYEDESLKYGL